MGRHLLLLAATTATAVVAATSAAAAPAAQTTWAAQANQVCVVWLAKVKKELGSPVTAAQLYSFAVKAKTLESQEYAVLAKIPNRTDTGDAALKAMQVDIAEVGSAITAWNHGNAALFVKILKAYLNDGRAKSAFAVAGANKCG